MNIIADDVDRFSMPQKGQPKILVLVYYKPYFSLPYLQKLDEMRWEVTKRTNTESNFQYRWTCVWNDYDQGYIALQFRFDTQT